jgi:hypothetical protein
MMGLMPLVIGMPMRCSDVVDRKRKLFKHTRCKLVGWKLREEDASVVEVSTDAEYVLSGAPLAVYVEVRTRMTLNTDDTSVEIVEVLPKRQSWSPDANGNIRVSRFGFQLVPDFAGTIHSFVGTSLDAAMLDCLEINKTPSHADQLKGYLGKTRVRTKEGLLVVQPFHPMLFRQGPLPGPKLIMEYQRGEISDDNSEKAWGDAVESTQAVGSGEEI